jgi:hypothetical protein
MFLMAWRLTKLAESGTMSHEQASLVKAWNTLRGREVRCAGCGCWWWTECHAACVRTAFCKWIWCSAAVC